MKKFGLRDFYLILNILKKSANETYDCYEIGLNKYFGCRLFNGDFYSKQMQIEEVEKNGRNNGITSELLSYTRFENRVYKRVFLVKRYFFLDFLNY